MTIAETPVLIKKTSSTIDTSIWSDLLKQLLSGESLSISQAADLMQGWLTESISPALSGAILAAIESKGVSAEELIGMAQVLHSQSIYPRQHDLKSDRAPLIDTCGTGGDGASTFNISTAVAFVAAAAGIKVAKHGNRSASSKTGSADVLEALGIDLNASSEKVQAALGEIGITFIFAPGWHPALKAVASLRKELKIRTIFNLLGPLVNPLQPTGQVLGVCDPRWRSPSFGRSASEGNRNLVEKFAQALCQLGLRRAIVVRGREKLDEAGLADVNDLAVISQGKVNAIALSAGDLGINPAPTTALKGGNVRENAEILQEVLQGGGTQAQRDVVALNTALALFVGEAIPGESNIETFTKGVSLAQSVLSSGEPWKKLEQLAIFLKN
jgi:anthranilate phosphoribosyltransferase